MTSPQSPDSRTAPLALWRSAGAFITTLFNLFGAPQDLAAEHTLTAKTHALIVSWLHVAEAFLRHIEASALDCCSSGPPASSRHRSGERRRVEFFAHQPETWRVSFRCASSPANSGGSVETQSRETKGRVASRRDKRFHSAWPLAERFEALLRVYNNPAPYARRLARRLHAAPAARNTLLRTPEEFEHRIDDATRAELSAHIAALKPTPDSS